MPGVKRIADYRRRCGALGCASIFAYQTDVYALDTLCVSFYDGSAFCYAGRSPILSKSAAAETVICRGQNREFMRFVSNCFVVNRAGCAYNSLSLGGSLMPVWLYHSVALSHYCFGLWLRLYHCAFALGCVG